MSVDNMSAEVVKEALEGWAECVTVAYETAQDLRGLCGVICDSCQENATLAAKDVMGLLTIVAGQLDRIGDELNHVPLFLQRLAKRLDPGVLPYKRGKSEKPLSLKLREPNEHKREDGE